jgi:hypothetical protein
MSFNPEPFTIIEKHGNSVVIQSNEGEKYKRNVTHVKKFIEREASDDNNNTNMSNESVVQFEKEKHFFWDQNKVFLFPFFHCLYLEFRYHLNNLS